MNDQTTGANAGPAGPLERSLPIPPRYEIREALARVIEPEAWRPTAGATWRNASLEKADACLALLTDLGGDEERQSGSVGSASLPPSREGSEGIATVSTAALLFARKAILDACRKSYLTGQPRTDWFAGAKSAATGIATVAAHHFDMLESALTTGSDQ